MSAGNYSSLSDYENALIEEARKKAKEEWQEVEKRQRLANLYQELGFKSTNELIKALQSVSGGKAAKSENSGKRVRITPEIAAKVKEMKNAGKGPSEISRTMGISVPSVYNILKKA
ncbi:MAG: hypothetical protein LBV12_05410 [Puniceicoccales bacterium]|jgi:hypothetical protein|nr:hypothetical protein [Puniceicoccales bacterium]